MGNVAWGSNKTNIFCARVTERQQGHLVLQDGGNLTKGPSGGVIVTGCCSILVLLQRRNPSCLCLETKQNLAPLQIKRNSSAEHRKNRPSNGPFEADWKNPRHVDSTGSGYCATYIYVGNTSCHCVVGKRLIRIRVGREISFFLCWGFFVRLVVLGFTTHTTARVFSFE